MRATQRGPARVTVGLIAGLIVVAVLGAPAMASPPSAQDRALAAAAVLHLSDFPAGWAAGPRTDNAKADRIRGGIADCRRYQALLVTLRKQAEVSANFLAGNEAVSSTVLVLNNARAARSTFAQLTSSNVMRCLERFLGDVIPQSITVGGVPARLRTARTQAMSEPATGDQTTAFQVLLALSAARLTVPVYEGVVVTRVGRSVAEFGFENPGSPIPTDLRSSLVNMVVNRLESARSTPAP